MKLEDLQKIIGRNSLKEGEDLDGRRRLGEGETWRKENSWDKEVESPLDPIPPPRRPRAS